MRKAGWIASLSCAVMALAGARAAAHEGLHEEIAALTRTLEARPDDAGLLLRRAELYRLHRQWSSALADLARAQELEPRLDGALLCGARVFLEAGVPASALALVERYLVLRPDDPEALRVRAELALRRGAIERAVRDLDRALLGPAPVEPDHYLARAEVLARLGPQGVQRALDGLDAGLERLGPVAALELCAIDLELARGHFDDALARLDQVLARAPRPERWLAQRGEILRAAGRPEEALQAFVEARVALGSLPPSRRSSAAVGELESAVECRLHELGARSEARHSTRAEP